MITDNTSIFEKNNFSFLTRNDTKDIFVIKEVFNSAYKKLKISDTDIVLDIGANIGAFAIYASQKNPIKIYSYEADKENYDIINHNLNLNGLSDKIDVFNVAVIGNDDTERLFSAPDDIKNKGTGSLIYVKGRPQIKVNCININKILDKVKPTIIKMDIEGGEYECIKAIESFNNINQFIFEFHHYQLKDRKSHEKYNEILSLLETKFTTVDTRRDPKTAVTDVVYCYN